MRAHQEHLETQLKEWSAKIDLVKARAQAAEAQTKIKYYDQLEDLRIKEKAARTKLETLGRAGADSWETLREAAETALHELRESLSKS